MRKTAHAPFSHVEERGFAAYSLERVMVDHTQAADGCRLPPALDDLALIAAIDSEARADVMAHLRDCPYCADRAHAFAELQGLLRKQFYRMFCPTSDDLAAYQQGMLDSGQRTIIGDHLKECPHCSRELKLLVQISHDALSGRAPPQNGLTMSGANDFAAPVGLRRVAAELLPSAPRTLAGAYGALRGPSHTSQYAYHAENLQLTIGVQRVVNRGDRRVMLGALELDEVLPEGLSGTTVHLLHNDILICTAELDELGNFVLDDLTPGTYRLALRLPDREVIVEALSL
jgi:anti-sigma factor RsiW